MSCQVKALSVLSLATTYDLLARVVLVSTSPPTPQLQHTLEDLTAFPFSNTTFFFFLL